MKPIDLDSMKTTWKNERNFQEHRLSEADIEKFLSAKSKDIGQLFRSGLLIDIVLKSVVGISFVGIMMLFRTNLPVVLISSGILLLLLWTVRYQWLTIGKIPEAPASHPVIRTTLEDKINFYHQHYIKSLYVGALSNSLLILSGMLYYFYFKYGELRPFLWDDYLVLGAVIVLGFVLGAAVQIAQHKFQVKQLESCLREIDEDAISSLTIREQRNKKARMILIFLLALVCGLLILAFFIFR